MWPATQTNQLTFEAKRVGGFLDVGRPREGWPMEIRLIVWPLLAGHKRVSGAY